MILKNLIQQPKQSLSLYKMKIHLYNIPSIDQYVNKLISEYLQIQGDFSQGDILMADRIKRLQQKSRNMLKNIDAFMNMNALDPRVKYLYAARNKLFKFLEKIKENKLAKEVNQMKESESVADVRKVSGKKYQQESNQKRNTMKFADNQSFEIIDASEIKSIVNRSQKKSVSNKKGSNQKLNLTQIKEFQSQQIQRTPHNQTPINNQQGNSSFIKLNQTSTHNRTPSTAMKNHRQYQRQPQTEELRPRQNLKPKTPIKTPIKTSRKTQSFTPRNNIPHNKTQLVSNTKLNARYQHEQQRRNPQTVIKSQRKSNITPRSGRTQQPMQRTPNKLVTPHSNMQRNQPQAYTNRQNQSETKPYQAHKQPSTSSAMKNLANLIFTIKMTKDEYNQFKKIKEQHQGQMGFMQ